jgi:hypothetical protein
MTLWNVLTFGAGAAAFGGGLYEANLAKAGAGWVYYVALAFVVLVAAGCVTTIRAAGRTAFKKLLEADEGQVSSKSSIELSGRLVYAGAAAWCAASPFITGWLTERFVSLLR